MKVEIDENELYAILRYNADEMLDWMQQVKMNPAYSEEDYESFKKYQKRYEQILKLVNKT